jgi:hypothetical protein
MQPHGQRGVARKHGASSGRHRGIHIRGRILEEYYLRAVFLSREEISPQLALVNLYLATYILEKSIQAYPGSTNAHVLMGAIYLQWHKYAMAIILPENQTSS